MLKIRKGTQKELSKYYTMMEVDFDERELIGKIPLQLAMLKGNLDFYVAYDTKTRTDIGYALVFKKSIYDYVLIKYLGIFPWYRANGVGNEFLNLLLQEYPEKKGVIAEIPVFEENGDQQINKLKSFFAKHGFVNVKCSYRISGAEVILMCKPVKGETDISPIAHRIIKDIYSEYMPEEKVDIEKI